MRKRVFVLAALVSWLAPPSSAVSIDWVNVGDPGNASDSTGFGSVAYHYRIAQFEVTNSQYTEFLNAVAATDSNGLYNGSMASGFGGITQSCSPDCSYQVVSGRGDMPVNYVSFYDALRFANWMDNGQPTGAQGNATTEDGAYTITAQGIADNSIMRNASASIAVASENEWYKAAYYDPDVYYDYPAGSDFQTTCSNPTSAANHANCDAAHQDLAPVGSYTGSASPYGTFDQGGNAREWNEEIFGTNRGMRGGSFVSPAINLAASSRFDSVVPTGENAVIGFRLVFVPEPGTGALLALGLAGLAHRSRRRGSRRAR